MDKRNIKAEFKWDLIKARASEDGDVWLGTITVPAVSVLHLNKWMTEHDELPRCVDVHAAKAAALADFDWLKANHDVVYVSEALDMDRFREHGFDPPVLARIVGGTAHDGLVSLEGEEVELLVDVTIEGREGQFVVRLGRRRAYDVPTRRWSRA